MKFILKAKLAIAASAAVATLIACSHQAPVAVPASPPASSQASNLPPAYFGPAYSAAAVYSAIPR